MLWFEEIRPDHFFLRSLHKLCEFEEFGIELIRVGGLSQLSKDFLHIFVNKIIRSILLAFHQVQEIGYDEFEDEKYLGYHGQNHKAYDHPTN